MFALRMQPEVFNEASIIWAKVCHTLYRIKHLCITCVTHKSKGGSEWGKHQKNHLLKRCRMRVSTYTVQESEVILDFQLNANVL